MEQGKKLAQDKLDLVSNVLQMSGVYYCGRYSLHFVTFLVNLLQIKILFLEQSGRKLKVVSWKPLMCAIELVIDVDSKRVMSLWLLHSYYRFLLHFDQVNISTSLEFCY
jgi:hypothetical protein